MKKPSHTYTVRDVSPQIDVRLRETARENRVSLNQTILKVLEKGLGLSQTPVKRRDLSSFAAALTPREAENLESVVKLQRHARSKDWA